MEWLSCWDGSFVVWETSTDCKLKLVNIMLRIDVPPSIPDKSGAKYPACGKVFMMTLSLTSVHKCKHWSETHQVLRLSQPSNILDAQNWKNPQSSSVQSPSLPLSLYKTENIILKVCSSQFLPCRIGSQQSTLNYSQLLIERSNILLSYTE